MKQKIGYIIIAVIVVAVALYLFLNTGNKATAPVTNNEETNTVIGEQTENPANVNGAAQSPLEASTKNSISVSTQEPGTEITIDNFYLEKPGFIVIHESKNDTPGTVVGNSGLLKAGAGQDLTFKANLKPGSYFATLYTDNGDSKFNVTTDNISMLTKDGQTQSGTKFEVEE